MIVRQKVFGIGFHKTATTSLGEALRELGYSVKQGFGFDSEDIDKKIEQRAVEIAGKYDAFEDNPWPLLYRLLDEKFPGSKFIATWRDPEAWFKSVDRHFGMDSTRMREWIYGVGNGAPRGKHDVYIARYVRHYQEIEKYFEGRPNDLLKLDLNEDLDWEHICCFLGTASPKTPFPNRNVGTQDFNPLWRSARQSVMGRVFRKMVNHRRANWT